MIFSSEIEHFVSESLGNGRSFPRSSGKVACVQFLRILSHPLILFEALFESGFKIEQPYAHYHRILGLRITCEAQYEVFNCVTSSIRRDYEFVSVNYELVSEGKNSIAQFFLTNDTRLYQSFQ